MEKIQLKECLDVIIDTHPFAQSINEKLLKELQNVDYDMSYKTNLSAKMTNYHTTTDTTVKVTDWIKNILQPHFLNLHSKPRKLIVKSTWFAKYDKGDFAFQHKHYRDVDCYSFVYFIKTPRGSSPLVFSTSGKRVKAEEGKVVIFPAVMQHHVPKNRCHDRIVLCGNIVGPLNI